MPFGSGGGGGGITAPYTLGGDSSPQLIVKGTGGATYGEIDVTDDFETRRVVIQSGSGLTSYGGPVSMFNDAATIPYCGLSSLGLYVAVHAAPADGDLSAGDCYLWFDQTNGAAATKLMVKGKSADGTVKTATIVLT